MFILSDLKDIISISPTSFENNFNETIKEYINKKYANKVIYKIGLVISLWDFSKFEDSHLLPNDANAYTRVFFRLAIFSPFIDEIIIGKIKTFTRDGIYVSLGFFDDIIIPSDNLQVPSHFDEKEQTWYWEYNEEKIEADSNNVQEPHKLFMDSGEEIRFRVTNKIYVDQFMSQINPNSSSNGPADSERNVSLDSNLPSYLGHNPPPLTIIGSISEPGLGLLPWWN